MIKSIISVSVLLATAACGAPAPTTAETTPTTAPTTPEPMPTPTPSGPSIAQFASIVAKHHAAWDARVAEADRHCLDPQTVPACKGDFFILSLKAESLALDLLAVHTTGAKGYVGEPPAEVSELLHDTELAAAGVHNAVEAFDAAGCKDPLETKCGRERVDMMSAISKMSGQLDAWGPYS